MANMTSPDYLKNKNEARTKKKWNQLSHSGEIRGSAQESVGGRKKQRRKVALLVTTFFLWRAGKPFGVGMQVHNQPSAGRLIPNKGLVHFISTRIFALSHYPATLASSSRMETRCRRPRPVYFCASECFSLSFSLSSFSNKQSHFSRDWNDSAWAVSERATFLNSFLRKGTRIFNSQSLEWFMASRRENYGNSSLVALVRSLAVVFPFFIISLSLPLSLFLLLFGRTKNGSPEILLSYCRRPRSQ